MAKRRLLLIQPFPRRLQKLIPGFPDACGHVEGGREGLQQQPMRIQRPTWLTSRPHLRCKPIVIRLSDPAQVISQ